LAATTVGDDGVDRGAVVAASRGEVLDYVVLALALALEGDTCIVWHPLENEAVRRRGAVRGRRRRACGSRARRRRCIR
jgi:hypothetical protein